MSELSIALLSPERVMVPAFEMAKVDRFTGYDEGRRENNRRTREASSPEFMVTLVTEDDNGDITEEDYPATIVASNVPVDKSTGIQPGDPVAIAEVSIDDMSWYLLISKGIGRDLGPTTDLRPSEILVQHEGEPEDLLSRPDLFEPAD